MNTRNNQPRVVATLLDASAQVLEEQAGVLRGIAEALTEPFDESTSPGGLTAGAGERPGDPDGDDAIVRRALHWLSCAPPGQVGAPDRARAAVELARRTTAEVARRAVTS